MNPIQRLLPLLLLIFIDSFSYFVVIPVLLQVFFNPDYALLPADTSQTTRLLITGWVIGLSTLASLIFAPLIGSISDKYGRKKTLLICLSSVSLGFLLPIWGILKNSLFLLLLGRFLAGVGSASQPVAQAAVADIYRGKEKAFALSLIALMMTLPIILGPLAGGYLSDAHLIHWFNITTPYLCAFLLSLLNLVLMILFFKETLETFTQAQMLSLYDLILGLKQAIKNYKIGVFILIFFLLEFSWSLYYQSIDLYLSQKYQYSAQKISLFYTYTGLFMCLGLIFLYPLLIKKISVKNTMRYGVMTVFISLFLCILFKTPEAQWALVPLISIFTGTTYVSLISLISDRVPQDKQGWAMGYLSTVLFLAWMLTGLISGWVVG